MGMHEMDQSRKDDATATIIAFSLATIGATIFTIKRNTLILPSLKQAVTDDLLIAYMGIGSIFSNNQERTKEIAAIAKERIDKAAKEAKGKA